MTTPRSVAALSPADPRIDRLAGGLRAAGVGAGDRVTWQLPNSSEVAPLLWACWRIGAVAVPVHHRATDAARDAVLDPLGASVEIDAPMLARLLDTGPPLTAAQSDPSESSAEALILHTSGSTGTPKGVIHTHGSLADKAVRMVGIHGLGDGDVVLMPAPLAHISGVLNGVTLPAAAGMRTVLMDRWDPERAVALIEQHGVSFMVGPPTFFVDLRDAAGPRTDRLASLRLISAGGTGVTAAFCRELAATTGARVKRTYGSTEAPSVTTTRTGGASPDPEEWGHATDGRAIAPTEVRIGDRDEVQVRGPELFARYTDAAHTVAAFTDDGWFRTGDRGRIDAVGCLTITGRLDDLIIRGGENVSPTAVEAALAAHPAIVDAAVVGVADTRLGERIGAVVVVRRGFAAPEVEELSRWCSDNGLARFAHPEVVAVADEVPRLAAGKPDRQRCRSILAGFGP